MNALSICCIAAVFIPCLPLIAEDKPKETEKPNGISQAAEARTAELEKRVAMLEKNLQELRRKNDELLKMVNQLRVDQVLAIRPAEAQHSDGPRRPTEEDLRRYEQLSEAAKKKLRDGIREAVQRAEFREKPKAEQRDVIRKLFERVEEEDKTK